MEHDSWKADRARSAATRDFMDRMQQATAKVLAERHSLFAFIYGLVRHPHDAEDIFQETWLRLSRALAHGAEIEDPVGWCRGTARNLILHYWRDRRSDKVVADEELLGLVEQAFAEQAGQAEYWQARQQALQDCVAELPERSQHLLRLTYSEGLSADAVARALTQSVESVWTALSRLRKALRDCAERKLRLEGGEA